MTPFEAIQIARKYNLEAEVRQELASGLTPEEALREWDINYSVTNPNSRVFLLNPGWN